MHLYIGSVLGGPELENSRIDSEITQLLRLVKQKRTRLDGVGGVLNVVFHLSGSVTANNFTGIRTATFSKKLKTLMIQVAVPEDIQNHNTRRFLVHSLQQAVRLAEPFFHRAGIAFDAISLSSLIHEVESEFNSTADRRPDR